MRVLAPETVVQRINQQLAGRGSDRLRKRRGLPAWTLGPREVPLAELEQLARELGVLEHYEMLSKSPADLARALGAALRGGDEGMAREWLGELLRANGSPTQMTAAKVHRITSLRLLDEHVVQFSIERHHEQRWGAIQTWKVDTRNGKWSVTESPEEGK